MSNFSIICLHTLDLCSIQYKKVLKRNEYYFFNNWYELKQGKLEKREGADFEREFFGKGISIQVIVGKNGSGKSSILDLLYRLINNLSYVAVEGKYRGRAGRLYFIRQLNAEFFYELDGKLGCVRCEGDSVVFKYGNDINKEYHFASDPTKDKGAINYTNEVMNGESFIKNVDERIQEILKHFFYSLIMNYSIQGLVPLDYGTELSCGDDGDDTPEFSGLDSWLDPIYDKNDGYLVPFGIEPYKGHNNIDLAVQKDLSYSRISVMLIDTQRRSKQRNRHYDFIAGYQLGFIVFYMKDTRPDKNDDDACADREFLENVIAEPLSKRCLPFFKGYNIPIPTDEQNVNILFKELMVYIIEKTFNILDTYPSYKNYSSIREAFFSSVFDQELNLLDWEDSSLLSEAIELIWNDTSHISTKIKQAVHLARTLQRNIDVKKFISGTFYYSEFIKAFYDKDEFDFISPSEILEYFPPSIFEHEIYLKKDDDSECFKLSELSSGERQFAITSAAYLYHIRNILSVPLNNENRIAYRHVNLFLDEIELCYHPEYQRAFIHNLIKSLKDNGVTDECSVNILLTIHSPFVLSDIPKSNILFLREGRIANDEIEYNTFGANINDLLHKSFFLENGFSGILAQEKINEIAKQLNLNNREIDLAKILKTIEIVGDPLIRHQLYLLYDEYLEKHDVEKKTKRIEELKAELRMLEN